MHALDSLLNRNSPGFTAAMASNKINRKSFFLNEGVWQTCLDLNQVWNDLYFEAASNNAILCLQVRKHKEKSCLSSFLDCKAMGMPG